MTKKQKATQAKKQIKEMLKDWQKDVLANVDKALESGQVPEDWIESDNYLLAKSVIDGSMLQRPYSSCRWTQSYHTDKRIARVLIFTLR